MIQRCQTKSLSVYPIYGGRGIKVCSRWRNSFDKFISDMGIRPRAGMSIDRIDPNGDYEPGNCRWATQETQANNTRRNRFIEFDGKRLTISQWARTMGIKKRTLHGRIYLRGWSVEKALTTPAKKTLDMDDVRAIKQMYWSGDFSQKELAGRFGTDQSNISLIINGKTWI